ncbi:PTHB1 C-terminus-domain-containing protein, partial [Baffinella frigidus]
MGTDPPAAVVNTAEKKQLNYEGMDEEHRQLLSVIRESGAARKGEPTDQLILRAQFLSVIRKSGAARKGEPTDQLILRAQVPNQLDGGHTDRGWEAIQVTVKLFVSYTGTDALEDVILMVSAPEQFQCSVNTTTLHSVTAGGTPRTVPLVFTVANPALPTDIRVTISASYQSRAGDPRVAFADISLPLCLCGKAVPPIKNGAYKMTVDTNRDPVSLPALFEDLVPAESSNALPNVLSFLYHSGVDATIIVSKNAGRYRVQSGSLEVDATIIVSKNAGRYRVQSGSLEALWLVTQQLSDRLSTHLSAASSPSDEPFELSDRLSTHLSAASSPSDEPFEIGYSEELEEPMRFYGSVIDLHFEARLALKAIHE